MTIEQAYRYDRRARKRMSRDTWGNIGAALILALILGALGAI